VKACLIGLLTRSRGGSAQQLVCDSDPESELLQKNQAIDSTSILLVLDRMTNTTFSKKSEFENLNDDFHDRSLGLVSSQLHKDILFRRYCSKQRVTELQWPRLRKAD